MNALHRPGRAVAAVGAAVAVGAATLAVIAGTAAAAEPGRCIDNVNVRAEPSMDARILSVCQTGTDVEVGETRNGFVQLVDLGGWASAEFVSVDGTEPAAVTDRSSTPDEQDAATGPGSSTDDTGSTGDTADASDSSDASDTSDTSGASDASDGSDTSDTGTGDATGSAGEDAGDAAGSEEQETGSAGGSPLDGLLP